MPSPLASSRRAVVHQERRTTPSERSGDRERRDRRRRCPTMGHSAGRPHTDGPRSTAALRSALRRGAQPTPARSRAHGRGAREKRSARSREYTERRRGGSGVKPFDGRNLQGHEDDIDGIAAPTFHSCSWQLCSGLTCEVDGGPVGRRPECAVVRSRAHGVRCARRQDLRRGYDVRALPQAIQHRVWRPV